MVDYLNGVYKNFYNTTPYNYQMANNPMFAQYGQYPQYSYLQNDSLFNNQNVQNNTNPPINPAVNFTANPDSEQKGSNKGWLIAGGLAVAALGIIFHKNIAKALGFEEKAAKGAKNITENLPKTGEELKNTRSESDQKIITMAEDSLNNKNYDEINDLREEYRNLHPELNNVQQKAPENVNTGNTPKHPYHNLDLSKIRVQAAPMEFAPHHYQSQDIPSLNLTTRTVNNDYTAFEIKNGKTTWSEVKKYQEPYNYLKMINEANGNKTILVAGKNAEGKRVVCFRAVAGRDDSVLRPIRSTYVFDAPSGDQFSKVQLDLMKGVFGKSKDVLEQEAPLSRAVKVIESLDLRNGAKQAPIEIDQEVLLREINHFAQGKTMPPELAEQLSKVDSLKNGEYIRIWG